MTTLAVCALWVIGLAGVLVLPLFVLLDLLGRL